ncbi:MAG TPA: hypothetical protein ENJ02_03690 [Chloroflexi bacterium]|nr:hypothetical protein [Chloroflexota bacterium]
MTAWPPLRWLARNLGTLFLAFLLALMVWISAVTSTNPNEQRLFTNVPLEVVGLDSDILVINTLPASVDVLLYAPRLTLEQYARQPEFLSATLDLSGLDIGTHVVSVQVQYALKPARLLSVVPEQVQVVLDRRVSQAKAIRLDITGEPARGYQASPPIISAARAEISGPSNAVSRVAEVRAALDITGLEQTIVRRVPLQPLDAAGNRVDGVTVEPESIEITQPVTLLGGYRNVVVKVITEGQVKEGYRLTNILVTPPAVTVFSSNPQLVNDLPGYVETQALNLSERTDDFEVRLPLALPDGVSVVGEQSVLVRVSIAAIEGSLGLSLPVEIIGVEPGLEAHASPDTVDVILAGPLSVLDNLLPEELRLYVDVSGLTPGVYQISPQVGLIPDEVRVQSILPGTLEVEVLPAGTATPTGTITATVGITSTPTLTVTLTPTP